RTLLSTFWVDTIADSGPGSLRQAILDVNSLPGESHTIDFALPGQGVRTITPASPLPPISGSVRIDGSSQPGYAGTPLIQLGGSQGGPTVGLTIAGPSVTVRGLAVDRFAIETTRDERLIAQVHPQ